MARNPDPFTDGYLEAVARVAAGDADRPATGLRGYRPGSACGNGPAGWLAGGLGRRVQGAGRRGLNDGNLPPSRRVHHAS